MRYRLIKLALFFFIAIFQFSFADSLPNYQMLAASEIPKNLIDPPGKILVLDFFSYACPHCAHLNPYLSAWEIKNAARANIIFKPIPVVFQPAWEIYSQAFYIAKALHQENKLRNSLFEIAQNPFLGLNSMEQLRSFFLHQGISSGAFDQVALDVGLKKEMQEDKTLSFQLKIFEVPTLIVVNGKQGYRILAGANPKTTIDTLTLLTTGSKKDSARSLSS